MTCSYVAFGPDMLHSPFPFGIQATWQGSVGCAQGLPTTLISSIHSFSAAEAAHHTRCASRGINEIYCSALLESRRITFASTELSLDES